MKKCPVCEKTFEDSMRFCQTDGTPLVEEAEAAPPLDPYATIVSAPNVPFETPSEDPFKTVVAAAGEPPASDASGDLLQIPEAPDPLKTMFASEEEIRKEMYADEPKEEPIFDVPSEPVPEPPAFSEPDLSPPSFGDMAPPASPFSFSNDPAPAADEPEPESGEDAATLISPAAAPIPSPFSDPAPQWEPTPAIPEYKEPEPASNPFDQGSFSAAPEPQQMEWAPPPAAETGWGSQAVGQAGQDSPLQTSPAAGGPSQGLAIGAMVCGILSLLCCVSIVTGPAGLIMGYIARKKAAENPNEFGGAGLATVGMITGGLGTLLFVVLLVLQVFFGVLGAILR